MTDRYHRNIDSESPQAESQANEPAHESQESWEPDWPESKLPLPVESSYWNELRRQILDDASGPLAAYSRAALERGDTAGADDAANWYAEVSRLAPWLVAASLAAGLLLWARLPLPDSATTRSWMQRSLTRDHLAASLATPTAPPAAAVMMQLVVPIDEPDAAAEPPSEEDSP